MNFKILLLALMVILMIGQTLSCCCCQKNSESYPTSTGACKATCSYHSDLKAPCDSSCKKSVMLEKNRRSIKKAL